MLRAACNHVCWRTLTDLLRSTVASELPTKLAKTRREQCDDGVGCLDVQPVIGRHTVYVHM